MNPGVPEGSGGKRFIRKRISCIGGDGRRIVCPVCGNDSHFYEIAENVVLTTKYVQNRDGSFTSVFDDSAMNGTVHFHCAECDEDLTRFHSRFVEMLF